MTLFCLPVSVLTGVQKTAPDVYEIELSEPIIERVIFDFPMGIAVNACGARIRKTTNAPIIPAPAQMVSRTPGLADSLGEWVTSQGQQFSFDTLIHLDQSPYAVRLEVFNTSGGTITFEVRIHTTQDTLLDQGERLIDLLNQIARKAGALDEDAKTA